MAQHNSRLALRGNTQRFPDSVLTWSPYKIQIPARANHIKLTILMLIGNGSDEPFIQDFEAEAGASEIAVAPASSSLTARFLGKDSTLY